jgi:hypothetical protein
MCRHYFLLFLLFLLFLSPLAAQKKTIHLGVRLQQKPGFREHPFFKISIQGNTVSTNYLDGYRRYLAIKIPFVPHFIEEFAYEQRFMTDEGKLGYNRSATYQNITNNRIGILFNLRKKYSRLNLFPGLFYMYGNSYSNTYLTYSSWTSCNFTGFVAKADLRFHILRDFIVVNLFGEVPFQQKFTSVQKSGAIHGDPASIKETWHWGVTLGLQLALLKEKK